MSECEHSRQRDGEASERPTRVRHWVLGFLCALAFVAYVQRNGFAQVGTDLRTDLGLGSERLADLMFVFLLAYAGFEVPWGALCDRLGARHLIIIVILGWSLVTACSGLAVLVPQAPLIGELSQAFFYLLGLRFLFGAFQAGVFPLISRVIGDWIPRGRRATAKGLVWTCSRAGGALAAFLVIQGRWELSLLLISLPGVLWCIAFWPWFRDRPAQVRSVNAGELSIIEAGCGLRPLTAGGLPWRAMLGSRSVWCLCCMYGFAGFTASFYITLLPDYLRSYRGLSPEATKWISSVPMAFGVVGCAAGGFISDRLGRRAGNRNVGRRLTAMSGFVTGGFCLLGTIWVHDPWALGTLLAASFFCFDLTMGPAWASCVDIGERSAGAVGGAMNMFGNLGAAAGILVARSGLVAVDNETVSAAAGNDAVFIAFACSYWLAAVCWLGVDATRPLEEPTDGTSIGTRRR